MQNGRRTSLTYYRGEMKPRRIKGDDIYYALLCIGTVPMICGVYSTHNEAKEANEGVKDCPAKHTIKKCYVSIQTI